MTTNSDNAKVSRRDFLKVVFATTTAAVVSGSAPLWPSNAVARPVSEPFSLGLDEYNYLIDPDFSSGDIILPTHRERLSLEGLKPKALKKALNAQIWEIGDLISDPDKWSIDEVEWWLDSEVDHEDLGAWQSARLSPYGAGLEIYNRLDREDAFDLGLELVEGDTPGGGFVGVAYFGDVDELNSGFQKLGLNLVVIAI
jgi:hypothetical protein